MIVRLLAVFLLLLLAPPMAQAQLRGHGGPVRALAISPDGSEAISGSFDTSAIRWSLPQNTAEQVLHFHDGAVNAALFLPNGRIATAGDAANIILSAVGYNLRLVLAWLRMILRVVLLALFQTFTIRPATKPIRATSYTDVHDATGCSRATVATSPSGVCARFPIAGKGRFDRAGLARCFASARARPGPASDLAHNRPKGRDELLSGR
jgi:hypothetical protein